MQGSRSTSAKRKRPSFSGKRKLLLISERADNSDTWNERLPLRFRKLRHLVNGSGNFFAAPAGRPQSREKSSETNGASSGLQPLVAGGQLLTLQWLECRY